MRYRIMGGWESFARIALLRAGVRTVLWMDPQARYVYHFSVRLFFALRTSGSRPMLLYAEDVVSLVGRNKFGLASR